MANFQIVKQFAGPFTGRSDIDTGQLKNQSHVVDGTEKGDEIVKLEYETDFVQAKLTKIGSQPDAIAYYGFAIQCH